jgi:hypothetical protein
MSVCHIVILMPELRFYLGSAAERWSVGRSGSLLFLP